MGDRQPLSFADAFQKKRGKALDGAGQEPSSTPMPPVEDIEADFDPIQGVVIPPDVDMFDEERITFFGQPVKKLKEILGEGSAETIVTIEEYLCEARVRAILEMPRPEARRAAIDLGKHTYTRALEIGGNLEATARLKQTAENTLIDAVGSHQAATIIQNIILKGNIPR